MKPAIDRVEVKYGKKDEKADKVIDMWRNKLQDKMAKYFTGFKITPSLLTSQSLTYIKQTDTENGEKKFICSEFNVLYYTVKFHKLFHIVQMF